MDEYGIAQQLLYPNLLGFHYKAFRDYDPALRLACVQAYNDFQAEFCEEAPNRLIPLMNLPFWDIDQSIAEMDRCVDLGHRGINFGWQFDRIGLPKLRDPRWTPLLSRAQELELPVSFHIGFNSGALGDAAAAREAARSSTDIVQEVALFFLGNASCVAELILSGLCERFPRLPFVSVESGFGFIPFLLQSLDWQFLNTSARAEHPTWLLPSEYFARQIYATFWFEKGVERQLDLYPDNLMFSSDFPHPTSLSPGPGSTALSAKETFEANLAGLEDEARAKVLHETARRLYHLPA
jgi:predicted TIM-barrel fold metal-dependent hydrolase